MRNLIWLNICVILLNTGILIALLYNYQQYKEAVFSLKAHTEKSLKAVETLSNEISGLVAHEVNHLTADAIKKNVREWWKKL